MNKSTITLLLRSFRSTEGIAALITGIFTLIGWSLSFTNQVPLVLTNILIITGVFIGGGVIAIGAVKGLLRREFNVDELVMLALAASLIIGEYVSAALVAFMMLFGKVLEDFTAHRATAAIEALGTLLPDTVTRYAHGNEQRVSLSTLVVHDTIIVRPGERIPVDGIILSGKALVDEAALTGESLPLLKTEGQKVLAGTIITEGALTIKASAFGDKTALGSIAKIALSALEERASVVRTADKYARFVTPGVLLLATATYLITGSVVNAVAVLVVACPCVLVLATPTAIIAGVAAGAKRGLLMRGGSRLEKAAKVDAIAFDKTGTLTIGKLQVKKVYTIAKNTEKNVLMLAAKAEHLSEHPFAKAIIKEAEKRGIGDTVLQSPAHFRSFPGTGVSVQIGNKNIVVGNQKLLEHLKIKIPLAATKLLHNAEFSGQTGALVAINKKVVGFITMSDIPKMEAKNTVAILRKAGITRIVMLTGDAPAIAQNIATAVGIQETYAQLLPHEKVAKIKEIQKEGYTVGMIGDGVNDAPALAVADVSIAAGISAADVSKHTADIVVMSGDLTKATEALLLSRSTLTIIKQNLWIAAVWNVLALGAAASGMLSPAMGAVIHNVGSVFVVINAARLVHWTPTL
ncbi:cation-translocating P-type ATPase [Candidatus Woesearchaeota archaeon]|nr:cation-translocating P-type ATPase [Candidatus Woesearchaeota archaeon]